MKPHIMITTITTGHYDNDHEHKSHSHEIQDDVPQVSVRKRCSIFVFGEHVSGQQIQIVFLRDIYHALGNFHFAFLDQIVHEAVDQGNGIV